MTSSKTLQGYLKVDPVYSFINEKLTFYCDNWTNNKYIIIILDIYTCHSIVNILL